ncbi:MAG TPA: AarF/UbiB family protein [Candidatus Eisenbacteria bacterium]|nr:AarF/UbiB family protein [Candidatus Eisenbacteria bacterium]
MNPKRIKRYRDIGRLLVKYGRKDLVNRSWFDHLEDEETPPAVPTATAKNGVPGAGVKTDERSKPEQLADDLEAMGPTFVKVGQFLSTRADFLPPEYLEALARLQDQAQPIPFAEVERTVTEELGARISKAFLSFEVTPLASASLGQVHRAELRSGALVAVKVQRPDIREIISDDLDTLADIASFLDKHTEAGRRYDFGAMVEEFRKSLLLELDYRQEARNLDTLNENLSEIDLVVVPSPVPDYVTSRVLTMEFICGRKVTALGPLARMDLDGAPLSEALCRAYLKQILVDGFFHADPHPGNVFVTQDGRIALLDLGMVGRLAPSMQESLLKLLLAISEGRGEDAAELAIRIGEPLPDFDETRTRRELAEMVLANQGQRVEDIQIGRTMLELSRIGLECGIRMPRELTMLAKALLNIDQVARALDKHFDPNASIRRNAGSIMRKRTLKSLSPGKVFAGMLEVQEFVEKLPNRLNRLIDNVTHNRVRVKVDAIDEVLLMEGLQKIANRITFGVVIAALIIGAALLMRIETRFRILGYPGLAILLFLGAAITGFGLVANIVVTDIRSRRERVDRLQYQKPHNAPTT